MTPEQIQVIQQAKAGDQQAISHLYRTHVQAIYRFIAYRVPSNADAEDLTSEVFTRMIEGLGKYEITGIPFEAWLYRIATHRIADFFRRRGRHTEVELADNLAVEDSDQPGDALEYEHEMKHLREALVYLNEEQQNVLILRFIENKSHEEVAELLGKSSSAVRTIQHRALVQVSRLLGAEDKAKSYLRGGGHE